jgi:hypothetical protein
MSDAQLVRSAVTIGDLFPFGPANGDLAMPASDDDFSAPISLLYQVPLFASRYRIAFVNINGGIFFGPVVDGVFTTMCDDSVSNMTYVAPYWSDINTLIYGNVYYRQTTDVALLAKMNAEVTSVYPIFRTSPMQWLLIVTWQDVSFFGASGCGYFPKNTFQVVIS